MRSSHVLTAGVSALVSSAITVAVFIWVWSPVDAPRNFHAQSKSSTSEKFVTRLNRDTAAISGAAASDGTFDHVRTIVDTLEFKVDFDQTVAIYLLLANADEAFVLDLLRQAESISPPSQKEAAFSIIYSKYAAIDPERALANAEGLPTRLHGRVLMSIFHQWSRNDLDSALEAVDSLEGDQRQTAGYVILTSRDDLVPTRRMEIAERFNLHRQFASMKRQSWLDRALQNPRSAWQESLVSTDKNLNNWSVRRTIAAAWITQEGIVALDEINATLPDQEKIENLISYLMYSLIVSDPHGTLDYISELPSTKRVSDLKRQAFERWAENDPEAAVDRLVTMDFDGKHITMEAVLTQWSREDPRNLFEYSDKMPQNWMDRAKRLAVVELARSSREEALTYLHEMRDSKDKFDLEGQIAYNWSEDAPRSALLWYLNLREDDSYTRHTNATDLMRRYADEDPEGALQLASQYSGEWGASMVAGVFDSLVEEDPKRALPYLTNLSGEQKKIAVQRIGFAMVSEQYALLEALDLADLLEKDDRLHYEQSVLEISLVHGSWGVELLSRFDELPSKELKVHGAIQLLLAAEYENFLSEQERQKLYAVLNDRERAELESEIHNMRGELFD